MWEAVNKEVGSRGARRLVVIPELRQGYSCVIVGKLFNLSMPQFLHMLKRVIYKFDTILNKISTEFFLKISTNSRIYMERQKNQNSQDNVGEERS